MYQLIANGSKWIKSEIRLNINGPNWSKFILSVFKCLESLYQNAILFCNVIIIQLHPAYKANHAPNNNYIDHLSNLEIG